MLRPYPPQSAFPWFLSGAPPSGFPVKNLHVPCIRWNSITGSPFFIPYFAGLEGIYCQQWQWPLNPTSHSSTVTLSPRMTWFYTISNWATSCGILWYTQSESCSGVSTAFIASPREAENIDLFRQHHMTLCHVMCRNYDHISHSKC